MTHTSLPSSPQPRTSNEMKIEFKGMPEWGRRLASFAIKDLAEAIGQRSDCSPQDITRHLKSALKHQSELLAMFAEPVPWTEAEADLSRTIHTFLRKYDDSPAGTIIYRMVDRGQGMQAWKGFIHALIATQNRRNLRPSCFSAMEYFAKNSDEFNDTMRLAIKAWLPDPAALEVVLENCIPKNPEPDRHP